MFSVINQLAEVDMALGPYSGDFGDLLYERRRRLCRELLPLIVVEHEDLLFCLRKFHSAMEELKNDGIVPGDLKLRKKLEQRELESDQCPF
jgi:hypothetical protein